MKVDSVTLTAYMGTGTLMIQGHFVLEWFINVFPTILAAYDAPIQDPQRISTAYSQYTESWKHLMEEDRVKKGMVILTKKICRQDNSLNNIATMSKTFYKLS